MVKDTQKTIDGSTLLTINSELSRRIDRGIDFLAKGQEKDGSFFCFTSPDPLNFKKVNKYHTIFSNALILSCLNNLLENPRIKNIKDKLVKFLLSQKSEHWSFNYWTRNSKEAKTMPYPDDLDDTFCALAAIYEYNQDLIDGAVLAKAVTILTALEEKEGGPYKTWLVPPTAQAVWKDVDLAVNSNIAYFLSLQDILLPNIKKFIENAIDKNSYASPYYPSEYIIIYFISRWYNGKKKKKIIKFLLKKQKNGIWENQLNTAFALFSLLNFGIRQAGEFSKPVDYLLKNQDKNGAWQPFAFCIDPAIKGKKYYAGSSALTTALCLEAINKFQKSEARNSKSETDSASSPQANSKSEILNSKQEKYFYNEVIRKYRQRFSGFSGDFQEKAVAVALKISKKNKDIVLLPQYFRDALGKRGEKISDELVGKLGTANLFGWIAYTIYDDFLDEEGEPAELSLANVCLRESAEIFAFAVPAKSGFADYSKKIFDIIDNANYWEITNCRLKFLPPRSSTKHSNILQNVRMFYDQAMPNFGDYTQLANKSLGHALGPVAILFALGYRENSREVKDTMRFFKNYIIARQLNDDAHDWEDDLKKGQVNAVGARLLRDAKGKTDSPEKLREIFWHKTILSACKDILRYVELAKKDLKKLSLIKESGVFSGMLTAIERSAEEALKEREETMKFLKTYKPH